MDEMQVHRLIGSVSAPVFFDFAPPFSCFDHIDTRFAGLPSFHRCFSLARSFDAQTLIQEAIPPVGIIAQENEEIASLGLTGCQHDLVRLSFWNTRVTAASASTLKDENLVGYAILKRDAGEWEGDRFDRWHIFEAVFRKYAHTHNCLPNTGSYSVRIADGIFTAHGVLYCQQNGLNKVCAHVALRSLLSRLVLEHDISYSVLNTLARNCHDKTAPYLPKNGLTVQQIRCILQYYKIGFRDVDYAERGLKEPDIRKTYPYQKYLYSGIESGVGGLLGFSMDGPQATAGRHIIPFYGHTFNKDTWAPDADVSYFNIGADAGYIPSESWTSSFLGHDDNFGPNFCIPRLYVNPENVQYVVELLRNGAQYNGMVAEALALQLLYSLYPHLDTNNTWQRRLAWYVQERKVVLRAFCIPQTQYLEHLRLIHDWENNTERTEMLEALRYALPPMSWIIEFSIPQLFPANERKLGEIILDACCSPNDLFTPFIIARLPGNYLVLTDKKSLSYERIASQLQSHVEVMRQND